MITFEYLVLLGDVDFRFSIVADTFLEAMTKIQDYLNESEYEGSSFELIRLDTLAVINL